MDLEGSDSPWGGMFDYKNLHLPFGVEHTDWFD